MGGRETRSVLTEVSTDQQKSLFPGMKTVQCGHHKVSDWTPTTVVDNICLRDITFLHTTVTSQRDVSNGAQGYSKISSYDTKRGVPGGDTSCVHTSLVSRRQVYQQLKVYLKTRMLA